MWPVLGNHFQTRFCLSSTVDFQVVEREYFFDQLYCQSVIVDHQNSIDRGNLVRCARLGRKHGGHTSGQFCLAWSSDSDESEPVSEAVPFSSELRRLIIRRLPARILLT